MSRQLAFVVDRDGDETNNYRGLPPFEKDTFDNTDYWIVAEAGPDRSSWQVEVTDAAEDGAGTVPSAAQMILSGDTLITVVPMSELGDAKEVIGRHTSFSHDGGFGQDGGEWSLDATPPVGERFTASQADLSWP